MVITVNTDNELKSFEYPTLDPLSAFQQIVGGYVEEVRPNRMPKMYHASKYNILPVMLVNENGLYLENLKVNLIGSWLYEIDRHGHPIVGNIVICGMGKNEYGELEWCDMPEEMSNEIYCSIEKLLEAIKK